MAQANLYGYDVEAEDLRRRQALADQLQMQAMQAPQGVTVGGMGAAPHWTSLLANAVSGYGAGKANRTIKEDRTKLSERAAGDLASGLDAYRRTSEGYTIPETIARPGIDPVTPGDPKKAIMDAMASQHPQLQRFGMDEYTRMMEGQLTAKDLAGHATSESVLNSGGNPQGFVPQRNIQQMTPGSVPLGEDGLPMDIGALSRGQQAPPAAPTAADQPNQNMGALPPGANVIGQGEGWRAYQLPDGTRFQESAGGLKKLDDGTNVTVNNNTQNPETQFQRTLGEKFGTSVAGIFESQAQAETTMSLLNTLEELNSQPTYSGPTANLALGLSAFAETLGLPVDNEQLVNSETYKSALARQVSTYLTAGAGVGRSLTDADRKVLESQFPQLVSTPAGRTEIIGMLRGAAQRDMEYGNATKRLLEENFPDAARLWNVIPSGAGFGPTMTEQAEAEAPAATGGVMTLEEYARQHGITP